MVNYVKYAGPLVVAGVSVEISEKGRVVLIGPDRPALETLDFMPYSSVRVTCGEPELESNACHQQEETAEFLKFFAARIVREAAAECEAEADGRSDNLRPGDSAARTCAARLRARADSIMKQASPEKS